MPFLGVDCSVKLKSLIKILLCILKLVPLTYSPRLKAGDSGINKDCTSRDGLTPSTPMDNALPMFISLTLTEF